MTEIKVGDRVKVTLDAEIYMVNGDDTYEVKYRFNGGRAFVNWLPASALEVIKPPIRVGDTVTKDQLNDLPTFTYVRGGTHGYFLREPAGRWQSAFGIFEAGVLGGPFTVLYIPED